jgi:hypothetical protein
VDNSELHSVLNDLGERVPPASQLVLVGGSALMLLGSPRPTLDIDFYGDDIHPSELHRQILNIAKELKVNIEAVPLDRFIPLPEGSEDRKIAIGQFGNLDVYVADPYSIALSKVDRGLKEDFDDLVFLIEHNYISLELLEEIIQSALPHAGKFDFHPEILEHVQALKNHLK